MKDRLPVYDKEFVNNAIEDILRDQFQGEQYTIRLWNAERRLEELSQVRCLDGKWRDKPTKEDLQEMDRNRVAGGERWRPFADR